MKGYLTQYLESLEQETTSTDESLGNKEEASYESRKKELDLKHKDDVHKLYIENEQQNTTLRLKFAHMVFWLTVCTLGVIAFLIIYSGIAHLFKNEFLSDRILTALIVFAGVDMLGLFSIILTYLFNKPKRR